MESGGINYDIRIYHSTNNQTICQALALTNTEPLITNFTSLANISTNQAIWELQIRVTGDTTVYINSAIMYYG